jgi:superfamily II DNA/RNA helicase
VVDAYNEHTPGRRAIAFCADVAHIYDLSRAFADVGIPSAGIDGSMPTNERRRVLQEFRDGKYRVLSSCEVLTEGFDDPGVDAILMARPTKSRPLYTQCIGRGLRLFPGKEDLIVLDITDNSRRHKLVTAMTLMGKPDESDVTNAFGRDVMSVVDEEMARLEGEKKVRTSRPLEWRLEERCPWPEMPDLKGFSPHKRWHQEQASEKQAKFIRSFGLDVQRDLTKGEASWLIDQCLELDAKHPRLLTDKQMKFLRWKRGFKMHRAAIPQDFASLTKREASKLIGQIMAQEKAAGGAR